jgi:hypothetical protein
VWSSVVAQPRTVFTLSGKEFSAQIRTDWCYACGKGWDKMEKMDEKFGADNLQHARDGGVTFES